MILSIPTMSCLQSHSAEPSDGILPAVPRAHSLFSGRGRTVCRRRPIKAWVGRQQEIEDYLKRAEVVRMEETKVGVTRPAHAYLAPGGPISEMAWKALPASAVRNGYRESYKAELAAYEMDHSRTFRYGKSSTHELTHIDRALWDRMKGLTRDQLATTFGSLLDERDINGILDRCEVMQRSIDKLVKSKGEAAVFTN